MNKRRLNLGRILTSFNYIEKFFLDALFPIFCQSCQKEGSWLCKDCLEKIEYISFQVCPYCEKEITEKGQLCKRCKDSYYSRSEKPPISSLALACEYESVSSFVHLFKYRFIEDFGQPLGEILIKNLIANDITIPDIIIPVPLHKRRLRWRGFNQSEILANHIAENISPGIVIPVQTNMLIRKKYTRPQMKVKDYESRTSNLKNSFEINYKKIPDISGKNILLVDDIVTTGATIFECAKLLVANGAKKVSAAAIARQKTEQ